MLRPYTVNGLRGVLLQMGNLLCRRKQQRYHTPDANYSTVIRSLILS